MIRKIEWDAEKVTILTKFGRIVITAKHSGILALMQPYKNNCSSAGDGGVYMRPNPKKEPVRT